MGEPPLVFAGLRETPARELFPGTEPRPHRPPSLPLQDVLHRHALYLIVRMVCYDDGLGAGKSLLALKTVDTGGEAVSLWVYQCSSLVSWLRGAPSCSLGRGDGDAPHASNPGVAGTRGRQPAVRASCGGTACQGPRFRVNTSRWGGVRWGEGPALPGVSFHGWQCPFQRLQPPHRAHRSQEHGRNM